MEIVFVILVCLFACGLLVLKHLKGYYHCSLMVAVMH